MSNETEALDKAKILELCEFIGGRVRHDRHGVMHRLTKKEGLKVRKPSKSMPRGQLILAGVESAGHPDEVVALTNWTNAARRKLSQEA